MSDQTEGDLYLNQLKILTSKESKTENTQYYIQSWPDKKSCQITDFPHPYPQLASLQKELIDLSELQCSDCLDRAIGEIPNCCSGKIGGRVLKPSCNFRFETERFYNPTANSPPPSPPPPAEGLLYIYLHVFFIPILI